MKNQFSTPMAMLIVLLTLLMFFQHTEAGTPKVSSYVYASTYRAEAEISCGIEGKLKNKESYSGSAYCYVRMTTESGTESETSGRVAIWARVYRTWWPFGRLKVKHHPTVSVLMLDTDAIKAYAYARGSLGSVTKRDEYIYPNPD